MDEYQVITAGLGSPIFEFKTDPQTCPDSRIRLDP